jgi:hypothetical protein
MMGVLEVVAGVMRRQPQATHLARCRKATRTIHRSESWRFPLLCDHAGAPVAFLAPRSAIAHQIGPMPQRTPVTEPLGAARMRASRPATGRRAGTARRVV